MRNNTLRLTILLTLCALVFMFALRAKTAGYNGGAAAKVTPATASKLWLSGQKMEVRSVDSGSAVLFWIVPGLFLLSLRRETGAGSAYLAPSPNNLSQRYLHRFLRPPPVLA
jgi:hypothetical protein